MQIVPINALPSQNLTVVLGNQACQIGINQKFFGIFVDLYVNNVLVIGGVIAQNKNRIVRTAYLGFTGDICFIDTQGKADPVWTGLGDRFVLAYLTEADQVAAGVT